MLDVRYEAVTGLAPGRLTEIDEDRGRIRVRLDQSAPLADVVRQLNREITRLLCSAHWFQLWKDEIVSRDTPGRPLRIEYRLEAREGRGTCVEERKGLVTVYIDPSLDAAGFAAAMNPVTENFLDGGQWFQLYAGEIIDNSPEPNKV
ncbi:hypothetical protein KVH30_01885 [Streptomyces olivaceus]|uniref:hypothetical protein n=1 Tax=Streptomyces olivaceus TaxID=47716 RepID=UPI001CCF3DEA|nr:hypothetical protein [Streptomyces olivaceus]MBZ6290321.1 hypothetical protein [Streptomyces olivaceus]MBZ6324273.1 hypothetical protein [Streptomyces olivaceus]